MDLEIDLKRFSKFENAQAVFQFCGINTLRDTRQKMYICQNEIIANSLHVNGCLMTHCEIGNYCLLAAHSELHRHAE